VASVNERDATTTKATEANTSKVASVAERATTTTKATEANTSKVENVNERAATTTKATEANTSKVASVAERATTTTKATEANTSKVESVNERATTTTKATEANTSKVESVNERATTTTKATEANTSKVASVAERATTTTKATEAKATAETTSSATNLEKATELAAELPAGKQPSPSPSSLASASTKTSTTTKAAKTTDSPSSGNSTTQEKTVETMADDHRVAAKTVTTEPDTVAEKLVQPKATETVASAIKQTRGEPASTLKSETRAETKEWTPAVAAETMADKAPRAASAKAETAAQGADTPSPRLTAQTLQAETPKTEAKETTTERTRDDILGSSRQTDANAAVDGKSPVFAERARRAVELTRVPVAAADNRKEVEPEKNPSTRSAERLNSNLESLKQYAAVMDKSAGKVSLGSATSNPFRVSYKLESNSLSSEKAAAKPELELLRSLEPEVDRTTWGKLDTLAASSNGKAADAGLLDASSKQTLQSDFSRMSARMDSKAEALRQSETQPPSSLGGGAATAPTAMVEVASRLQGLLKAYPWDSSKVTMNINTEDAGTVVLTVEEKANTLSIRVEVQDESSKEQFANSRDDLEAEARRFGFKDVSVDISSGGDGQRERQQQQSGNEDINNVRLAGREDFDLSGLSRKEPENFSALMAEYATSR